MQAIINISGDKWASISNGEVVWKEGVTNLPSNSEIQAEMDKLQAEYDAQEYARKRQAEYPPWNEQLDKIFHDGVAKWKSEMVQPVKDKYPKPE